MAAIQRVRVFSCDRTGQYGRKSTEIDCIFGQSRKRPIVLVTCSVNEFHGPFANRIWLCDSKGIGRPTSVFRYKRFRFHPLSSGPPSLSFVSSENQIKPLGNIIRVHVPYGRGELCYTFAVGRR